MLRVKMKKGVWVKTRPEEPLFYERCPNKKCGTGELHYTYTMKSPHCPDCKTDLLGSVLERSVDQRVSYYLGE